MAFSIQLKMALFARLIIGPFHPTLTIDLSSAEKLYDYLTGEVE